MKRLAVLLPVAFATVALAGDSPFAAFKKAYDGKDEASRLAAVAEIGKIQSRVVISALAPVVAHDPSANVRRSAAKVLGGQWASTEAAKALGKALHPDDDPSEVTLTIVAALGETQSDAAVPSLLRLLKNRPRVYAGGAQQAKQITDQVTPVLDALRRIGSATAAGDLVEFVMAEEPGAQPRARRKLAQAGDPLLHHAMVTLAAITGENRTTPEAWQEWWDETHGALKTVMVLRCELTGKVYDRPSGKQVCPGCGGECAKCSSGLKTRYEQVPLVEAQAGAPAAGKKKGG